MNAPRTCIFGCHDASNVPYRAAPGLHACHRCAEKLRRDLAALERAYNTLADINNLIPGGHGPGGHRTPPGPRSPAVDAILVHTDVRSKGNDQPAALATVESWARAVREDRGAQAPAGRATMARELETLRFHWDWVLGQPWLDEFAADMRAVLAALRIVGRETERRTRVGRCPVPQVAVELPDGTLLVLDCGAWLHVRPGAVEIQCCNCGQIWPYARWPELGDPWTDYAYLATELAVPPGTLRRWRTEDDWRTVRMGGRTVVLRLDAIASYTRRRGALPLGEAG